MVGVLDFILWCAQEAGVLLGVGAALLSLVGYVVILRDNRVSAREARYSSAMRRVIALSLLLMILSGAAITALHLSLGQGEIISQPVFIFKWLLIAALSAAYVAMRAQPYGHRLAEGALGGTWFTLFIVHTAVPAVSWSTLCILYAFVMGSFLLVWEGVTRLVHENKTKEASAASTPAPVVAAAPTPVAPPPLVVLPPAVAAEPPKVEDARHSHWLPVIHVMPKTAQQLEDKSHITTLGKFSSV